MLFSHIILQVDPFSPVVDEIVVSTSSHTGSILKTALGIAMSLAFILAAYKAFYGDTKSAVQQFFVMVILGGLIYSVIEVVYF